MDLILAIFFCLCIISAQTENVYKTIVIGKTIFNPDGFPRQVISVKEEGVAQQFPFPGPLLRATKGDIMHLTVKNNLDTIASIHCHGLHMLQNPWMDGAVGITECGINPKDSFTYIFNLTQTGTFWYHDHSSTMYLDGLLGPLVIDYPTNEVDPVQQDFAYTKEHVILMQDWMHETGHDLMALYRGPYGSYPGFKPNYPWPTTSILINGRGTFDCKWDDCSWLNTTTNVCEAQPQCIPSRMPLFGTCQTDAHPLEQFECTPGEYVRIRLINGASNLPLRFWIDRHPLTIVARDGVEVEYITVDNVTIPIAQRIDVIVKCDRDPMYRYMIYVAPSSRTPDLKNISASAQLVYPNATLVQSPKVVPGTHFTSDVYFEYKHLSPKIPVVSPPAVERLVITYNVAYTTKPGFPLEEWVLNNISFMQPSQPLLPAYYQGIPFSELIQQEIGSENLRKTNIKTLNYDHVYEVVLIGNDVLAHPWHIHGYCLDFLEAGSILPYIQTNDTDECNETIHNISGLSTLLDSLPSYDQPRKAVGKSDSFVVPAYGYVVFRFKASNAGPWLFHCHIEWHMMMGMAMLFSVENSPGVYNIQAPLGLPESCVPPMIVEADEGSNPVSLLVMASVCGCLLLISIPYAGYGAWSLRKKCMQLAKGEKDYGLLK